MCLAIPGKIVDRRDDRGTTMGTIDFGGVRKDVCLAYVPEIEVGDYAIVHAGFAIARLDEAAAMEALRIYAEMGSLDDRADTDGPDS